jgi:tRNA wybutosine-synthesizing protein 1
MFLIIMQINDLVKSFEKKQYGFCNESSIQVCEWNKKAIRTNGEKHCYKQDFYGADTLSCHQIAPNTFWCNNSCIFCWRPKEYMFGKVKKEVLPDVMIEGLIKARKKLLQGFYGSVKKEVVDASLKQKHWAISLSGEPTLYKHLPKLIKLLKNRPQTETVFLVTNGQNPKALMKLKKEKVLPTQLYLSLQAPNKTLYKKISCNVEKNGWKNYLTSLAMLKLLGTRTVIRLTLIKGLNDDEKTLKEFSELLEATSSDFVEIKSYMWLGLSRQRLKKENMPTHEEVKFFAKSLLELMPSYKFESEKIDSRIVLLKNKNSKYKTKIINRK